VPNTLSIFRTHILSPWKLVKKIWHYDFQDFKLILEQSEELNYFYVSAKAQKFTARAFIVSLFTIIIIFTALALNSYVSYWRYQTLEASKIETEKKHREALSAIAALSDHSLIDQDDIQHDQLIKVLHEYRDRMEKMQILIDFSSKELKLASYALEEGLKASGVKPSVMQRLKNKFANTQAAIGGNSTEISIGDKNSQLLNEYRLSLAQLQELKRLYQAFPTKLPITKAITTSKFGVRVHPITNDLTLHEGLDYAPTIDNNAKAVLSGTVEKAEESTTGYGNMVILLHPNNVRTTYAHLERIFVQSGQQVAEGDILGTIGSSGFSTGKHLHYEISINNIKVNPSIITAISENVQ